MNNNVLREKIVSLQSLRALAFIGIFLCHAGSSIHWSALGVSIFFVMSGFLMEYTYNNRDMKVSLKENIKFSLKKIKKLYPLHILTMICAILLNVITTIYKGGFTKRAIIVLLGEIGLNVTLLQSWFPNANVNTSLNGVAWYLSVTMFLYIIYPYIRNWIKNKSRNILSVFCIAILVFEILSCIPWIYFLGSDSLVYRWFMYCFPLFRAGDFFIGCCFGKYYLEKMSDINSNKSLIKGTMLEIVGILITILVLQYNSYIHTTSILQAINNWTTIYIPLAVMWLYIFIANRGLFTKILNNRILIFIGNISAYTFLIHYVITRYVNSLCGFLNINLMGWMKMGLILIEFCFTILLSMLYIKITQKIKNKKNIKI